MPQNFEQLYLKKKYRECEKRCRQQIARQKGDVRAWEVLVRSLLDRSLYIEALQECRKALKVVSMSTEDEAKFHTLAGDVYRLLGQDKKACARYEKAVQLLPGQPKRLYVLAETLFRLNRLDRVVVVLDEYFRCQSLVDQQVAEAVFNYVRADASVTATELFLKHTRLANPLDFPAYHTALGEAFEREGDYRKALTHFVKANDLQRAVSQYDSKADSAFLENLLSVFDDRYFKTSRPLDRAFDIAPIFIVGMPRSGTSLLEQMLGAHSQVYPLGEVRWLEEAFLAEITSVPDWQRKNVLVEKIQDDDFCLRIRDSYFKNLDIHNDEIQYVVDKLPGNVQYLWLIWRIFPEAVVLNTQREKESTVWSCFKTRFSTGQHFSESFADCEEKYDVVQKMADTWGPHLANQFIRINYEDFVNDSGAHVDMLLDRLGLPREQGCYDPSTVDRPVATASRTQVMKPVYKDANRNWKLYQDLVAELKEKNGEV